MAGFTGGCLCGAIRYEVSGDPLRVQICHCDDCRRATGSPFAANAFVREDDFRLLKGTPKKFTHRADSGNEMTKEFCGECGSQLFGYSARGTGMRTVKIGSIDDIGSLRPQTEVFVAKKLPFTRLLDETEHFERGRPAP